VPARAGGAEAGIDAGASGRGDGGSSGIGRGADSAPDTWRLSMLKVVISDDKGVGRFSTLGLHGRSQLGLGGRCTV